MKTRYFARYEADINIRLHIPLVDTYLHTVAEFVCPFCLKALTNVSILLNPLFPRRWFDVNITYKILEPEVSITESVHWSRMLCHSYQQISWLIMREILYAVSYEFSLLRVFFDHHQ